MGDTYAALKFWFDVVQAAGTVAVAIYVWWGRRKKDTEKRFKALEDKAVTQEASISDVAKDVAERKTGCGDHKQRTEVLEKGHTSLQAEVNHLPSRHDLSDLSKQIGSLTEKLGTLDGRLGGINRAVDLLNQHHLGVSG